MHFLLRCAALLVSALALSSCAPPTVTITGSGADVVNGAIRQAQDAVEMTKQGVDELKEGALELQKRATEVRARADAVRQGAEQFKKGLTGSGS